MHIVNDVPRVLTRLASPGLEPLNVQEMRAISNLFAWAAAEQSIPEASLERMTAARFGVDDAGSLGRKDYDEVIRFLVSLGLGDIAV
jgi:hypothetical protein